MNLCFFTGKIISDIDFKFIINKRNKRKNISIATFEVELNNKSKITVIGYNEIADFCFSKLKQNDEVILQGYLNKKIKVILNWIRNFL